MAEKVTTMVLVVDLQCCKCYRKVKKVLCKFPEIRDQVYDDKANTVTIKVVGCDPEKLKGKLCCKGGGSIKSIEIKPPPKPSEPKPKPESKPLELCLLPPIAYCCTECYHGIDGGPCYYGRPPPLLCYCRPVHYSWGYNSYCYCDENPRGCLIM